MSSNHNICSVMLFVLLYAFWQNDGRIEVLNEQPILLRDSSPLLTWIFFGDHFHSCNLDSRFSSYRQKSFLPQKSLYKKGLTDDKYSLPYFYLMLYSAYFAVQAYFPRRYVSHLFGNKLGYMHLLDIRIYSNLLFTMMDKHNKSKQTGEKKEKITLRKLLHPQG